MGDREKEPTTSTAYSKAIEAIEKEEFWDRYGHVFRNM